MARNTAIGFSFADSKANGRAICPLSALHLILTALLYLPKFYRCYSSPALGPADDFPVFYVPEGFRVRKKNSELFVSLYYL